MKTFAEMQFRIAQDRIAREIESAAQARLLDRPGPSVRRTVGLTFIRIGHRLASEPSLELARSR
jgi:hypothetical protein